MYLENSNAEDSRANWKHTRPWWVQLKEQLNTPWKSWEVLRVVAYSQFLLQKLKPHRTTCRLELLKIPPLLLCVWNCPCKVTAAFGLAAFGCWSGVLCRQWSSVRPHTARGGRLLQSPHPGNLKAVYSWDHKAAAACRHQQGLWKVFRLL